MRPGETILPVTSRTSLAERLAPIAETLPSANAMSATLSRACEGSTSRPPFKTKSFISVLSHPAHGFRQRSGPRQRDALQPQPVGHQPQLLAQRPGDFSGVMARLEMGGMDQQLRVGAVGLEIDPRDQQIIQQEGQHVIAVLSLGQRRVDLDAIEEVEYALGAVALPDQGIERRQQGARLDAPRLARGRVEVSWLLPAFDLDGQQVAGLDQLGQPR